MVGIRKYDWLEVSVYELYPVNIGYILETTDDLYA